VLSVAASLGLSALILVGAFLAYHRTALVWSASPSRSWAGEDLHLLEGTGKRVGPAWRIEGLSPQRRALLASSEVAVQADQFAYLDYVVDGLKSSEQARFFWRSARDPARAYAVPLVQPGLGSAVIRVDANPSWKGTIIQLGIVLRRNLPGPVVVERLTLRPASAGTLLSAVWSDWTAVEGWSSHSANFTVGGATGQAVRPAPASAAWAGLALACYGLWVALRRKPWSWGVAAAIFLVAWLALDARWQLDLWRQLVQTQERYGGKSLEAKRLAADDGELYAFLREVKKRLPSRPRRIFLVTAPGQTPGQRELDRYLRLRSLYHLLPQNVDAYLHDPPPLDRARPGDYVLTLGNVVGVTFDPEEGALRWHGRTLAGRLVYLSQFGALYEVR
jgi:hypothetical protein